MNLTLSRTHPLIATLAATLLLSAGCQAPEAGSASVSPTAPAPTAATPNFGPAIQDVRTQTTIQAMEQDYNAAKNSQPTHQHEAELEAARKLKAQQQQAEAAKAAETPTPETKP